jgi:SAM-dependent methyltransferase
VHGHAVHQCRSCGARFFHPQPTDQELAAIYTAGYFLGHESEDARERVAQLKRGTALHHVRTLQEHLGRPTGRLLEIGCGKGEFLLEAQWAGFDVHGLEYSSDAAAAANIRLGADRVQVGQVGVNPLEEAAFDAIVFFDVIEHVRDPLDYMRRVARALRPGGVIMLTTPAVDTLSARLMGRHWMEYKTEHLFYFTERSLRGVFDEAGLVPFVFKPNVKVLSFDYVYRHFERFRVPGITTVMGLVRRCVPDRLANRQLRITSAGSVLAVARKPNA